VKEKRNERGGLVPEKTIGGYQRDAGDLYGLNALDRGVQEPLFDAFGNRTEAPNDWGKLFKRKIRSSEEGEGDE